MTFNRSIITGRRLFAVLFLANALAMVGFGQRGTVDPTFNPVPSTSLPTDTNFQQVVQPDGKVIVYNASFMFVNGEFRSGMFRLNTDGSTDTTFSYNNEGNVGISNVMIAPDGKIVVAGSTSPNHAKMVRLNPNGSLDTSFSVFFASSGSPGATGASYTLNAIQPDGKVIATLLHWGNIMGTYTSYSMARYNLDASVDSSFAAPLLDGGHLVSTAALIQLLPDGRYYLGISSGNHLGRSITLSRRLATGNVDPTFAQFTRSILGGLFINFSDMAVTPDGGVLVSGLMWPSMLGSPGQSNLFKFLPDGSFDSAFTSPNVYSGGLIHLLPDGKILYSASGGSVSRPLIRLNQNGSVDNTYVLDPAVTSIKNAWEPDSTGRVVFLAQTATGLRLVRLLEGGSIDTTFNPVLGAAGIVRLAAVQSDGKVIVVGSFSHMNGIARNNFARLNADGTVDATFDPGTAFNIAPRALLIQPDGKILVAGDFLSYNGTPVSRVVRLNDNGTLDNTFNVSVSNTVYALALQPDGRILIGGSFSTVNTVIRKGIARLESNGDLDATFSSLLGGSIPYVGGIVAEPNGKIAIAGNFTGVNGADRNNFARLEANGATDLSFNAGGIPSTGGVKRQPDGKYITYPNGPTIERRNADGSRDSSFSIPYFYVGTDSGYVQDVVLMPDGSMIVGGEFNTIGGVTRRFITRLRPNGAHEPSFLTTGTNARVESIALGPNGNVIVSGIFNSIENVSRLGIARLSVPALQSRAPFDFDGDGRADISVLRPSSDRWYELLSSTSQVHEETFGLAGDVLAPADFDGDGITDEAIFRPSNGHWWYRSSVNEALVLNPFGGAGDVPRPSDFDGDGKADLVLFRPSTNTWFRFSSLTNQEVAPKVFGVSGDKPLVGDFDGDGKGDLAIFRPSSGDWWYAASSAGGAFRTAHWGQNGDIPVPADYDADGKTDYAVFRPSDGGWYVYNSGNGSVTTTAFGTSGDRPVAADYDGDGRADLAVFRPSTGIWYLLRSTSGFAGYQFGISTDTALPGALIP